MRERLGVVDAQHERRAIRESNGTDRAGGDHGALKQVQRHALGVRDGRLDRIGVTHDDDGTVAMLGRDSLQRGPHSKLHFGERFALRETKRARGVLHRTPLGLLREQVQLLPGPEPEVALEESALGVCAKSQCAGDRRGGLAGSL
jgi:hypothetical protein